MNNNNNNNTNTNSDKEWLYGKLKNGGLNVSYEDFDKTLGNEDDRKWYYDKATKMGLKVGSYDDFVNIFAKPQKPISVAQQVIDEYDASMRNAGVQPMQTQQSVQSQPVQPQPMYDGSQFNAALQVPDWTTQEQRAIENIATSGTATPATDKTGQPVYPVKPQEVAYDEAVQELRENMPQPLNVQLKSLQDDISVLKDDNKKKLKRYAGSGSNAMSALMGSRQYMQESKEDRQEAGALDAAGRLLEESQEIVDEAGKSGKTNFVSGLLRGVRDNAFDAEQWTFGLADMADSAYLLRAVQKAEKGEELTPAEEKLLDASVMNMAINAYYGDQLGRGYKAGKVTAQSLPFMLEFAVNPVSASGSSIAKNILKYGMKKFGASAVNRAVPRAAARLVGDTAAAAAMTGTTGAGRVASEAMNKIAGNYEYGRDEQGVMQAVKTGDMSVGEAIARGFGTTLLENQSEMIFNAFRGGGTAIKNAISESVPVVNKLSNSDIVKAVRNIKNNPVAKNLRERTQIGGVLEEYAEEVYNNLANVAIGEMSAEDALSLDNNIDTFLGLVPTQLAFSAIGFGGFVRDNAQAKRNVREFEQTLSEEDKELFSELRNVIQSGNTELPKDFIKATLADTNLTDEQKKERIFAVKDMVSEKQSDELQESLDLEEEYEPAMSNEELEANKVGIHRNYVRAERNLNSTNLPEGLKEELYGGGMTMRDIMATYDLDDAQIDAVTSFMDAKKSNDAYNDYVISMALRQRAAAQEQATQDVERIGNSDTGNVVQATWRTDGTPAHIVGGVLAYSEDGFVDKDKSSDVIYYVDENGERKMATAEEFETVVGDVPFQQYIDEAASSAEQEYYAQQQASLMSPDIPAPEKGVTFSLGWNNYVVNGITPEGNVAAYKLNDIGEIDTENGGYIELAPEDYYSAQETAMWGEPAQQVDKVSEIQSENAIVPSEGESNVSETSQEQAIQSEVQERQPVLSAQQQEIDALRTAGASEEALSATITQRANDAKKAYDKAQKAMNAPFKAGVDPVTEIQNRKNALEAAQAEYEAWNSMMPVQEETTAVAQQPQEPVSVEEPVQEQPAEQPAIQEEQPTVQQQEETIPTDEKGNVLYHRVPVDTTVREINSSLEPEEVDAFISENKKEADKELKAIEKKKPKVGTNIAKYKAEKQAWQELMSEARAKADYWNDVESEVKNLRSNIGDETAEEIRNMGEPMDGLELAARELASGYYPLLRSDYMRETGYSEDEVKNMFGLFRSKENGGMMLDVAGEKLMQADLDGNYNFFDQSDPNAGRNAIIEVLSQAKTRGDLINYIKRRREEQSKRESEAEYNAYVQWVEDNFQMSVEDYEAYMDRMERENPFEGVDNAELDAIFAEAAQEYEQSINNEEYGREQETGVDATTEGGDNVLPEQQSDNEGAVTGSTEERTAEESGQQAGVDDGAAQGETEAKPVTASKINKGENIFDYARRLSKEKEIADARKAVDDNPTDAQKEAGNYKKGHVSIDGLDITIENGKGSTRTGTDARGKVWSVTMQNDYGYIRGTKAVDGDHIDIFLSDNPTTGNVYVIDAIDQETGEFDESKVMYGFESADAAREAYLSNYEEGWKVGTITEISKEEFKKWIDSSTEKRKPFSEYKSVQESGAQNEEADDVRFREDEKSLVAVHNLSEEALRNALDLGGFPMPSIAVTNKEIGHTEFGEISLLFDKESINPTDTRNRLYAGDAWTPVFPEIGIKISEKVADKLRSKINGLLEGKEYAKAFGLNIDDANLSDEINRSKNFRDAYKDSEALKIAFLSQKEMPFKPVMVDKKYSSRVDNETLRKIVKEVNKGTAQDLTNLSYDETMALEPVVRKVVAEYIQKDIERIMNSLPPEKQAESRVLKFLRRDAEKELSYSDINNLFYDASRYEREGDKKEVDRAATREKLNAKFTKKLQKEYEDWLDEISEGIIEKRGIRNERDPFTPSGNRRSWEALYDAITLDNVVKAMRNQAETGGEGVFGGSIFGAAQEEIPSIDELRKIAKQRLADIDSEEYEKERSRITDRLSNISIQESGTGFGSTIDMIENITESVRRSHTSSGIYKYLKKIYPKVTKDIADEIADIVKDIQSMSTRYFEAKPYRSVGFNEVKVAVVPRGTSKDLISQLENYGIQVKTYKKGDEADRKRVVAAAAKKADVLFRNEETQQGLAENEADNRRQEIALTVTEMSSSLNTPIRMVNSLDEVTNRSAKRALENGRNVKAWFEPSTGEVVVYMPNATSVNDVKRSVLHEVVAHKGLRELIGEEEYDKQMEKLYGLLPEKERAKVENAANKKYGSNIAVAMDEYLAEQAERDEIPSWWEKAVSAVRDMLRSIGINVELTDGDVKYLLWRSRKKLSGKDVFSLADDIAMRSNTGIYPEASYREGVSNEQEIRYRTGDGTIEDYERSLETKKFKAREAFQDSMLALKKLQETIEKKDGVKLKASENAYMAENQMSSKSTRESEVYGEKFFKPMIDEVAKLVDKGIPYDYIKKYVMAKHGLERNEVFARRDAENVANKEYRPMYQEAEREHKKGNMSDADYQARMAELDNLRAAREDEFYNENRQKDYSGLSSLMETQTDYEVAAQDFVDAFEQSNNVADLWKAVNAATEQTLKKSYDSGMMSKSAYDKVRNQFEYYVPLRGWNEDTAEDVYEYLNSETSPVNSVLKSAKGRTSVADDPFATIGNMAESTILQGNRNEMKQKFLNMAINHPSDVLSVGKVWYVLDNATGEWVMSMPDIQEGDTADEIADKIDKHRERMLQLRENGEAVQQKANLDIDYRISQRQAKEHAVIVKLNGEDYVVYVNGNPRAAQAVNGMTNPDVEQNKIFEGISRFNRWMAANFTTRNPAFVLSNLSRDLIFSMSAVAVKEDSKYSSAFRRNIPSTMKAIARGLRGVQPTTEADKYFQEFLDNGGETGYTALHNVDEYKKMIDLQLKKAMNKTDYFKAVRLAADWFSNMNRWAEDVARFNAYRTSRQMGRSIVESVNDAKEITVNFNKKGSGYKTGGFFGFTSGAARNLYLFFNAAVQSLNNFAKLAQKNKKGFTALLGGFATAGFLVPMLNSVIMGLAGDDDDDYYQNLPEWVRRNNLCLYIGEGKFLTIPLPIELRAFYGLGEMAYQATIGKDKYASENVAYAAINQITELLPINPLGNQGDLVTTFMPDAIKPFWQIQTNTSFTGLPIYKESSFNENMPEWTKVYNGTSPVLVNLSEWTNEIAGGDKYQKAKYLEPIMNWNPAKVESLFESYFGGMATTINQTGKTLGGLAMSAVEGNFEENVQTRNIPVLNRFLNNASDDRMSYSNINKMYYSYYELFNEIDQNVRGYSKEASRGSQEYLEKLRELSQSEDFPIYQVFKSAKKQIDKLNKMEKSLPESKEDERKEIQKSIAEIKKSVVDRIIELKKKNQ